jgi:hypothetical protein
VILALVPALVLIRHYLAYVYCMQYHIFIYTHAILAGERSSPSYRGGGHERIVAPDGVIGDGAKSEILR